MDRTISYHGNLLFVSVLLLLWSVVHSGDYTLGMDNESSCTKTHYYKAGDVFTASAKGVVHGGHCPLTFIQSGAAPDGTYLEPCLTLCVKILQYTMESCQVKMAYHDGISDFTPVTFDCHTFPPVMWCSSKNDLKVTVSETKDYRGKNYAITLEVKPFCGSLDQLTTDSSIVAKPQAKQSSMSQTAVIIGAVVGTISILFVLGWLMYCYKKRNNRTPSHTTSRPDRNVRGSTPNQTPNRYAPVDRNPPSSLSSSDRGAGTQYLPDLLDRTHANINNMSDRRLYSPFQPPQPTRNQLQGQGHIQQKVLYSDIDRGPKPGDKWYPMTTLGPTQSGLPPVAAPANQYMLQNQIYKYPTDGEMHTVPTDTRYVVYDFDYETKPMERKYSGGKSLNNPYRQSPIKDIDRPQREITPLRETVRVMPPVERGRVVPPLDSTTDHTSDYESSVSGSSDEETTDDQMSPYGARQYNFVPNFTINNAPAVRPNNSNTRLYDPRNFQRIDNTSTAGQSVKYAGPTAQNGLSESKNNSQVLSAPSREGLSQQRLEEPESPKEGPVPQVPPMPKEFQRPEPQKPQQPQRLSPTNELPWPHGPPPPYSPDNKFVV